MMKSNSIGVILGRCVHVGVIPATNTKGYVLTYVCIGVSWYLMSGTKRFTMNFPEDLHKRLKHWCVDNNAEMGRIIRQLVEAFLATEEKKLKK